MVMRSSLLAAILVVSGSGAAKAQEAQPFPAPATEPKIVTPGTTNADPPSDAIVLFNGKDLSQWRGADGGAAKWTVRDGYVEVAAGAGGNAPPQQFCDVPVHIEWGTPAISQGESPGRGNSRGFLIGP